jgi:hypothetical protein
LLKGAGGNHAPSYKAVLTEINTKEVVRLFSALIALKSMISQQGDNAWPQRGNLTVFSSSSSSRSSSDASLSASPQPRLSASASSVPPVLDKTIEDLWNELDNIYGPNGFNLFYLADYQDKLNALKQHIDTFTALQDIYCQLDAYDKLVDWLQSTTQQSSVHVQRHANLATLITIYGHTILVKTACYILHCNTDLTFKSCRVIEERDITQSIETKPLLISEASDAESAVEQQSADSEFETNTFLFTDVCQAEHFLLNGEKLTQERLRHITTTIHEQYNQRIQLTTIAPAPLDMSGWAELKESDVGEPILDIPSPAGSLNADPSPTP